MKRTRKLVTVAVLAVAVVVSAITAAYALSANTTETYAYLPEHSVYFYDTAGEYAWASSEVDTLAVAGVIKGGGTHLFYPGNAITRADFIVMLDRAYGMSEALDNGQVNSNGSFVDVPSSAYYSKAVIAAKAFGIAAGTATGEFQPQQSMTRQDAMVFLKRTIDRTVTYTNGVFTFADGEGTVSIPAAADCVAIDVSQPYHQLNAPTSTGSTYRHCYPSIEDGMVTAIYYSKV